eukprot:633031_1
MGNVGVFLAAIARILENDENALGEGRSRIPPLLDILEKGMNNLNALEKPIAWTVLDTIHTYLKKLPPGQQNAEHIKKIQKLKTTFNPPIASGTSIDSEEATDSDDTGSSKHVTSFTNPSGAGFEDSDDANSKQEKTD